MSHRSGAVAVAGRRWSTHPEPDGADAARPTTRIQIRTAGHPEERRIPAAAAELGVRGLRVCRRWTVYHLEGLLSAADVARRCAELLGGGSGRSPRLTRWRWSSTGTGRSRRWPRIWVSARANQGNRVRQARIDRGDRPELTTAERAASVRLRRENAWLRMERDLLKRALRTHTGDVFPASVVLTRLFAGRVCLSNDLSARCWSGARTSRSGGCDLIAPLCQVAALWWARAASAVRVR